jgi:uncharacterized protein YceK
MKHSILKPVLQAFALLLAVLFAAQVSTATTAVMLTDEDLIASSRIILIGDVQSVKAQWDADHQTINTYVKVNVTRLLKGQLQNQTIVFKQLGGRVGDEATVIFGAPEYAAGQQVLLFLDTRQDGTLRVAHLFQGKYDIVTESGSLRVKRNVSRDEVNILGATEAPNITNDAPLARFTKKVKRVLRDYADTVSAYETQHAATPIVEVPAEYIDDAGQETGDVSAQYAFLGSYRWFEPDSNQPVTFRVNSSGAPTASGGVTEINQAFAAWTAVQTTALTLQNIGSTTAYGFQQDGVSALSFNDPLDQMSDPVNCSGTLAIGGVTSAGGSSRIIGGQSFSHIFEGDVVFNRNFSCFLGISANLAEVATHEIGHAIGFGHSSDPNAIMYATAHGNGRGATLGSDDIAAVTFLYPGSKSGTTGTNNSGFEWQLLPFSMTTGQTSTVQVTFRNTGTTTWVPGTYYLGSQNPQDNTTWGVNRVNLPTSVAPGAGVVFSFPITAPATAGAYNFQWRVLQNGVGYFGATDTNVTINVSAPTTGTNNSVFEWQLLPFTMSRGQRSTVQVTFRNTGTTTWVPGTYYLGSQNPQDNINWGVNRVDLPFAVAPGVGVTFTFAVNAPATAGTYNFQWRVLQSGVGYFGAADTNVAVVVK